MQMIHKKLSEKYAGKLSAATVENYNNIFRMNGCKIPLDSNAKLDYLWW